MAGRRDEEGLEAVLLSIHDPHQYPALRLNIHLLIMCEEVTILPWIEANVRSASGIMFAGDDGTVTNTYHEPKRFLDSSI